MACPLPRTHAHAPPKRRHSAVLSVSCALLLACWCACTSAARADAPFRTEPYLLDPQPQQMTLLFELASARAADVTLRGPEGERTLHSDATKHHLLRLRGLQPDSDYRYSVQVDGAPAHEGRFHTPRAHERTDARVCLYGDSRSGEDVHREVVAALRRAHAEAPIEAVVHLGDFAARGGDPSEWVEPFVSVVPLAREVGYLPVLGNHELIPDGTGRRHYQRFFGRAMGPEAYYVRRLGPLHLLVLDTNTEWPADRTQIEWARAQLRGLREAHPEDFILVFAHHPMFSSSLHEDHEPLRDALAGAVREHADLVFGGHDHTYERGTVDGLHYVVSGGGGSPLYGLNHHRQGQLAYLPEHHVVCLDARDGELQLSALRPDGSAMETCRFRRGGAFVCADGSPRGVIGGVSPARFWLTSWLLWKRMGPALALIALFVWGVRRQLDRRRARRASLPPR